MKIVATDGYTLNPGDNPWVGVASYGELRVYDRTPPDEIVERSAGAEILIINKTVLTDDILQQLTGLKFITMSATGYDCVDVRSAGRRNIPVSNIPVYGTDTVAQYVFSALLHLSQNIAEHAAAVKQGEWTQARDWCFWKSPLIELRGRTIGIVGFGRIGRRVGEIANAFGMKILACDPIRTREPDYEAFQWCDLEELFEKSDVVTLHSPLTEENSAFVNSSLISRMKPTSFLINAARGGLVSETDLARALEEGSIAGAVVDTVSAEPIHPDNPLLAAPNIFITPHLAWATLDARKRLMKGIEDNIRAFQAGNPINVVNSKFLT